jgi:FAD/FMN-containing dehydrogenase
MTRRQFIGGGLALAAALPLEVAEAAAVARVRPGQPGWPGEADWASLSQAVGGRLAAVTVPQLDSAVAAKLLQNPYYLGDQAGLTQSSGWLGAWRSSPSKYVVAAESPSDVAAAVRFARAHNLRLVVKGGGHSYLGASNAPDSLLVWTRRMNAVTVHDEFTPAGSSAPPVPAVSVGAGCIWLHAYQAVTTGAGRYVQGGGCATVGVVGLACGGGFGTYSKTYGMAGASLLEAEIVTADGQSRVVNHAQEPDLYWALKGGGGGTFGVVTRLTLATHDLVDTFGALRLTIKAHSDEGFRRLLAKFVEIYAKDLFNFHWGEQVRATPDNQLMVEMEFAGLDATAARAPWLELVAFADAAKGDYEGQSQLLALTIPARHFWDADFLQKNAPAAITLDQRPGASPTDFWWAGNTDEAGTFWYGYQSAWLPQSLLRPEAQTRLVDAWLAASRHWPVTFHINKGLAGAPPDAIAAARATATNPDVVDAFALAIIGANGPTAFGGRGPDLATGRVQADRVRASMNALRAAAPDTGAYLNECDYFEQDWQRSFWGSNYPRLLAVKRRYDPDGLFFVHHGVGSEDWSADGFQRA